jgi:hypothetical protein
MNGNATNIDEFSLVEDAINAHFPACGAVSLPTISTTTFGLIK